MERFSIIYIWTPLVAAIFLASPWVIYQVWAFISPGLYPRERKWAVPFIVCTGGLFLCGGLFAYFVAFRYALVFLLGIGDDANVTSLISIDDYFTNFVNVMLGMSVVFELPVLIFFLTLIRVASPSFLLRHSRYAILAIVILAAVVTPIAGRVQSDAVRRADDPAVLPGRVRELLAGAAPGRPQIPMEDILRVGSLRCLAVVGIGWRIRGYWRVLDEVARQHFRNDPARPDAELQAREHGELAVDLVGFPELLQALLASRDGQIRFSNQGVRLLANRQTERMIRSAASRRPHIRSFSRHSRFKNAPK